MLFTECETNCCICRDRIDWHKKYGRESVCCSSDCYEEFKWRYALSILGKPYTPRPAKEVQDA